MSDLGPPLRQLGASAERWGWEFRDPRTEVSLFEEPPPALDIADATWFGDVARRAELSRRGRRVKACASGVLVVAAGALAVPFGPAVALAPAVAGLGLGWHTWGRPVWLRRSADRAHEKWLARCVDQHRATQQHLLTWRYRRRVHEQRAAEQARSQPEWVPVRPATVERADVCGGSAVGWESLLGAMAGSLLGAGAQVSVLDLSQDRVTGPLAVLAEQSGLDTHVLTVPEQMDTVNLLAGLSAEEIGLVVTEAVHAAERDTAKDARSVDATLLQQVCEQLAEPVTFARLHAALRVLLRQEPTPQRGTGLLSRAEHSALSGLLGEAARRSAEPRMFHLAAAVARLAGLGDDPAAGSLFDDPDSTPLRVIQVSETAAELTAELLCQVLSQVLLRALRRQPRGTECQRVLVVAGADCLPRGYVDRLDQLARRRGVRLVLMFRHLRDDAVDLLGGGEAAVFMRLGNAKEAEAAATFVGREHRFVASQFTYSRGDSNSMSTAESTSRGSSSQESSTTGAQSSRSRGLDFTLLFSSPGPTGSENTGTQTSQSTGYSTSYTTGETRTRQSGTSHTESVGFQRSYEYTLTPKVLQELSATAFVLVDPRDPGSPRLGDCDPAILAEPRVADPPQALRPISRYPG